MLELVGDVAGLKVGMTSIEDKLDELSHRLLGNGQPGLIADLQSTDRVLADKIQHVEKKNQWMTGVWVGCSTVIMIVVGILKFILKV